jgi:hypothetical protein
MKRQPIYLIISLFSSLIIITLVATGVITLVRVKVMNLQFWANSLFAQTVLTNATEAISKVSLKNDGTIMVNGKSFFPLGLYHNSQASPDWSTTGIKRLNDLQEIAKAGFNTIHPEIGGNDESDVSFLKEALKLGVYVLPNFSYDNRIAIISKYKNNPAILGWDIADDVDHPNNIFFSPGKILGWHREVKRIDNNRLTYISGAFLNRIEQFIHTADIVGFQSYPIDNDPADRNPLRNNYYTYYALLTGKRDNDNPSELIPNNRTFIANLQSFPWKDKSPTFHQLRNMTYAALINGIKGIIYYTYSSNGWELSQNADLWKGMKLLAHEIKELSPIFLEGKLTKIDTQMDNLYAGQWTYDNSVYLVVLSTFPEGEVEASIKVSSEVKGSVKPLFPDQPSGMMLNDSVLRGFIKPGDVHVYQILKSRNEY